MAYTKQTFTAGQTLKASDLNTMSEGITTKQDKLVSGTNIKTINGQSLLGSGDITIQGGSNSSAIASGSYKQAVELSRTETGVFIFMLTTDEFVKPIWHIGNGVFVDSVGATIEIEDGSVEPEEPDTPDTPTTYTVTYNINGHGSQPSAVSGVTKLPNPLPVLSANGYIFGGWYTTIALNTPAVAGASISADTTLYAKWTAEVTEPEGDFTYTAVLSADNETIYVPTTASGKYTMTVDWGDDSEPTVIDNKAGYKIASHQYTGVTGDKFKITLRGEKIPELNFAVGASGALKSLYSIDNNTLNCDTKFRVDGCPNLTSVCANAFSNHTGTDINFDACTSLTTIESGFASNIKNKSNITHVCFNKTKLTSVDDDFFEGMNLTSVDKLFGNTPISSIPSSLLQALTNCTTFYYAFYGITSATPVVIPNNLFDSISGAIVTNVSQCFGAVNSYVSGDAKALYDVLVTKVTENANTQGCFYASKLTNRNQVPTAWGGLAS